MRKWPLVRSARIARLCLQTAGGCSRAICELQDLFIARPTSGPLGLHAVHCYAGADGGSLHGYFEKAACAAVTSAAIMDPARATLSDVQRGGERASTSLRIISGIAYAWDWASRRMQLAQRTRDEFGQREDEILAGFSLLAPLSRFD